MKNFNKWIVVPYCSYSKNPPVKKDNLGEIVTNNKLTPNEKAHLYNQELTKQLNNQPQEQIERFNNVLANKEQDLKQEPVIQEMTELLSGRKKRVNFNQDISTLSGPDFDPNELNDSLEKTYDLRQGYPVRIVEKNITKRKKLKAKRIKLGLNKSFHSKMNKSVVKEVSKPLSLPITPIQNQMDHLRNLNFSEPSKAGKIAILNAKGYKNDSKRFLPYSNN